MQIQELVAQLLKTNEKARQRALLKKHAHLVDLKLAEELKNTYYESWTTEPRKTRSAATALECLFEVLPLHEVEALMNWVKAIAFLTEGKTEKAIISLDVAAQIFNSLQKPYQAAQTQVSKLYGLALLGKYTEAVKVGEEALQASQKFGDELAAGKIEMNLGNIVLRRDFYREAEGFFLSAQKRFVELGETRWLSMCENNLAIIYSALNEFRQAEKFYTQSLLHAKTEKMFVTQAEIEASIGRLALFRGRFDEALEFLEKSRQRYEGLQMPHQKVVAELEIADVYLELNLLSEAFEIYERATKTLSILKMQSEQARARANFGRVATTLKKENLARRELKKAARLYLAEKNSVGAATVKLHEAQLELSLRNFQKALKISETAESLLDENESSRYRLIARWLRGEALRNLGKQTEAEILLQQTFVAAVKNEQSNLAQIAQTSLGKLFVAQKKYRQAEKHFRKAIELIETMRAPLPAEEFRRSFLADKLTPYEELAKIYLQRNEILKAFLLIENSRSRALAETLGDNSKIETAQKNGDELTAKLVNLREELNWFYSRLNRAGNKDAEKLQRETEKREKQISALMRQIESTSGAGFHNKAELDFARLQSELGANKCLIEYVGFDGQISAFVVDQNKIEFVEALCAESEVSDLLENLHFQFGSLRYGLQNLQDFLPELKTRADFYLAKLYEKLLLPLAKYCANQDLIVVPWCKLHYVPFHALFDGEKYAIEKRAVSYAPSATVLQFCLSKQKPKPANALLIAYADEFIPLVNREVEQVREVFQNATVLTGEQASVQAFAEQAANFDALHIACHGEFRPDNPLFSSLHLADGSITVRDVCAQTLRASLVTLSACETGLNSIFAGDEILGLARGFLTAGASSLVLSLWTVNDRATAELMRIFYERLQTNANVAEALRAAQIRFIEQNAHPYFWASFAVMGKW